MKFTPTLLLLAAAALAAATDRKRYIVTYTDDTDDTVIAKAMEDARHAGAKITHQYKLIKGFSVDAPTEFADNFILSLSAMGENSPHVEEDSIVTTQGGKAFKA